MGNAFFLVWDENPEVTERPANVHKTSKQTRDQACQLTTDPALSYQNKVFEPWKCFRIKNGATKNKIDKCSSEIHKCSVILFN